MSEAVNASALGAAGIGLPAVTWAADKLGWEAPHWVSVTALVVGSLCLLLALALWAHLLASRFGINLTLGRIPFHIAARRVYEAAEKARVLDLMISSTSSPEAKLMHFKMLLLVDDRVRLFGAAPPSTNSLLIPKRATNWARHLSG
jgi:hypothetical protein